jgi:hypothetical protein
MTNELDLLRMTQAASLRLSDIRQSLSERTPMKYALESLPELIGDFQFRMLSEALGLEDELDFARRTDNDRVGPHFAAAVAHKAQVRRRQRSQSEDQLSARLESRPAEVSTGLAAIRKIYNEVAADMDDHQPPSEVV